MLGSLALRLKGRYCPNREQVRRETKNTKVLMLRGVPDGIVAPSADRRGNTADQSG